MKKIPLRNRKGEILYYTLVDDEDFEALNQLTWHGVKHRNTVYACTNIYDEKSKRFRYVRLHRYLMKAPKGKLIDHRNHNGLDNQKHNLRICDNSVNTLNVKDLRRSNKSGVSGVHWSETQRVWHAYFTLQKNRYHLGSFTHLEDAAMAVINFEIPKQNDPPAH